MTSLLNLSSAEIDVVLSDTFKNENKLQSIEDAAQKLTENMYHHFQINEKSDFVLVRLFQSMRYLALPLEIQEVIISKMGKMPDQDTRFLTLLGTYGDENTWQSRKTSKGHQAIPLTEETFRTVPMISRLFQQIGYNIGTDMQSDASSLHMTGVSGLSGIFYVENANNSPYIPAQDFVKKYNVASVIGTGVMLPENEVAAFIGFTRVPITKDNATIIAPIMSKFWRYAFPLLNYGVFS